MSTTPQSTAAVIEQSPDAIVEWNLDNWPAAQFNRLVPTQTLGLVTDLIRPIVQAVQLDIERDTYESNDLPKGHRAPNAKGLALLAAAAGVDFPDEVRTDDGSDPMRASAKVWATMVDGVGRTRTIVGTRDYVLTSQSMSDAQRNRAKGHVFEHAATRARHRALRVMLGLAQSYPIAELQKPFAVVSYVPNLQHPELREAYKQALLPTVTAMYGPGAAKQLTAGPEVIDLDKDGEPKNVTPAPATPTTLPGEKLAAAVATAHASAPEEPEWMRGSEPMAKPAEKAKPVDFATSIRDTAAAVEDPDALAAPEQLAALRDIFAGWRGPGVVAGGLAALWPDTDPERLAAGQAQALATVHDSMGHDKFEGAWRTMLEQAAAA